MTPDANPEKFVALPVQLIGTPDGLILKRGFVQIRLGGERAADVAQVVLEATGAAEGASKDEICARFAAPDRPAIMSFLDQLSEKRILIPAGAPVPSAVESTQEIFYWNFDEHPGLVIERLNQKRLVILGVNCISRQLAASLDSVGVKSVAVVDYPLLRNLRLFDDAGILLPEQWRPPLNQPLDYEEWSQAQDAAGFDCLIATSDFGGRLLLGEWNEFCFRNGREFYPIVLQDSVGYVGPMVVPGHTACYECLLSRQNSHLIAWRSQRAVESQAFNGQLVNGFLPPMASVLGDIATLELTKFYSLALPGWKAGVLVEVNLLSMQVNSRKVLRIPRCPLCSPMNLRSSTTINKPIAAEANREREPERRADHDHPHDHGHDHDHDHPHDHGHGHGHEHDESEEQ